MRTYTDKALQTYTAQMYHSAAVYPPTHPLAFCNAIMTNAHKKILNTEQKCIYTKSRNNPFSFYSVDTLTVRYIVSILPRLTEKKRKDICRRALLCKQNSVFSEINCNENIFSIIARKKSLQPKAFHNTRTDHNVCII